MKDDATLLPEERLALLSDEIIQSIIKRDEVSSTNRRYLFQQLSPDLFRDENYIIYKVFYNFKDRDVVPDSSFLKIHLTHNTKLFSQGSKFINLSEFQEDDDNPYVAYAGAVIKKFDRLVQAPPASFEDFKLDVEKYREDFAVLSIDKSFGVARQMLYDGVKEGRQFSQGYGDSVAYIKKSIAGVDALVNRGSGDGFIDSTTAAMDSSVQTKYEKIGEFDLLPELNEHLGGIYTDLFYNICAPTKGGKSKFTTRMAHTIAVQFGVPISVWAVEGGYKAWWAQLRAIHFEYMYIRNKSDDKRVAPLSQMDILFGNYPSEELKHLEEASRIDLFTNPSYGRINMIDQPFQVESFLDSIDTSVQFNHSRAVFIDYLQLIQSRGGVLSKNQAIGLAYQQALSYCNTAHVAVISPSQFTQDYMKEMLKASDNGKASEIRTAGGESAEVTRTPDINIALYATVEDIMRKRMQILSMPSRMCSPFPTMDIYADLCSCVFASMQEG